MKNKKITPFMMFNGKAEAAIEFYTSVFRNSEIISMIKYDEQGPGAPGTVNHAVFTIHNEQFMAIDNANGTDIPFTPALSFAVECESVEEIEFLYDQLKKNGQVLMELAPMPPVAEKFAWVADQFGINWQLNLPLEA